MSKKLLSGFVLLLFFGLCALLASFSEAPEAKAQVAPWKFVVYSDSQYSYESTGQTLQRSVDAIKNKVPTRATIVGLGDFTLNGKVTDTATNAMDWTRWKQAMSNLVGSWTGTNPPQHIGAWGDHDRDRNNTSWLSVWSGYLAAQKGLTAYSQYPSNADGLYGSMKHQNALFVWLAIAKPEEEYLLPSGMFAAQDTYLANIMNASKNDSSLKWKFVFFHNGAETCGNGGKVDNERAKGWFNNYFIPNGVDMVFNGDTHAYLRTCPITNFVMGSGGVTTCENFADNQTGDPQGVIEVQATPISAAPTTAPACSYSRKSLATRNFVELEVNGDVLNFKAWNVDDGGTNPTQFDSLTIDKSVTPEPTPVTLTKTVDKATAKSGDILNYKIKYTAGSERVTNITVSDPLPVGTDFVPCAGCGSLVGSNVVWTYNDWAAGETGDLIFQARVK